MTLSERNIIFKAGIAVSFLFLVLCVAGSFKAIPVYASMEQEITRHSEGVFRFLAGRFLTAKLPAVHCCILVMVLYSFFTIIFIYYFFEKTQSPEILFIVFFVASFSTEAMRLIIPLGHVYDLPLLYFLISSRIILFGRFFGIFSIFAASLYAVGYETQRQNNVILILIVISLIISLGVPIDTHAWNSSLNMIKGYVSMFRLIEIGTFLVTTISFFIAVWLRSTGEFSYIGAGSVLVFLGRDILLNTDTWAGPPAGLIFLSVGTWLICTKLHKIYLWH